MSEPASSSAAAASSAIARGLTVGTISAAVGEVFGVDVITIVWALVGGFFGSATAPKVGPVKAVVQYLAASLLSALAATAIARYLAVVDPVVRYGLAAGFSAGFYLLKNALFKRAGFVIESFLKRVFGGTMPQRGPDSEKGGRDE